MKRSVILGEERHLPNATIDSHGHPVDLTGEVWRLNSITASRNLNWPILSGCSAAAVQALRFYVVTLIETKSPDYVHASFRYVGDMLRAIRNKSFANVSLASLTWYLAHLRGKRRDYQFHHIRQWYDFAVDQCLHGFDAETAFALDDIRVPGNAKGEAVLSSDPNEGPLSKVEEIALRRALLRDDGPIEERAAVWIALAYGPNPSNIALLCEDDYEVVPFTNAPPAYFLSIPRIKKRARPRELFKRRALDEDLAKILQILVEQNSGSRRSRGFSRLQPATF